ncbi:MAG: glycoside hydrolase family 97 C-terminal domain-containing protein, partial [Robiginitalea sp.]|nr:glycoside hydrolase family 97 C-terminal domain-containing protein [Robiginitalea sp.]
NWFVGAITDENPRDVEIDFSFLPEGSSFTAAIYRDGEAAHYRENPTAIEIETQTVDRNSKVQFRLAAGGGLAISLMKE